MGQSCRFPYPFGLEVMSLRAPARGILAKESKSSLSNFLQKCGEASLNVAIGCLGQKGVSVNAKDLGSLCPVTVDLLKDIVDILSLEGIYRLFQGLLLYRLFRHMKG